MQTAKLIGAGLCGLLAVGSLFRLLGEMPMLQAASAGGSAYAMGSIVGRVFAVVLFSALAVTLWRGANKRTPPRV